MLKSKSKSLLVLLASIWVAISPGIWWYNLKERYGIKMPLQFMGQDFVMSFLAFWFLFHLMRKTGKISAVIGIIAIITAASHYVFVNAFPDGLFINAATICFLCWFANRSNSAKSVELSA